MTRQNIYWLAAVLGISGIALSTLVPGGPIETRDFSHINPLTLGVFNTFLTTLCLGSLLLIYFVLRSEHWAMVMSAISGLSYLGVYGLDLAEIFPVSPDAMPPALLSIEVFGSILSIPLLVLSVQAMRSLRQRAVVEPVSSHTESLPSFQLSPILLAISLGAIALGVIVFSTSSAMGL